MAKDLTATAREAAMIAATIRETEPGPAPRRAPLCEIEAEGIEDEPWIRLRVITAPLGGRSLQELRISEPAARRLCRALKTLTDCSF